MGKRRKKQRVLEDSSRRRRRIILVAVGLVAIGSVVLRLTVFSDTAERGSRPASVEGNRTLDQTAEKSLGYSWDQYPGRPQWYPLRERPMGPGRFPAGDVRVSQEEAARYFETRLGEFVGHILGDPDELPYVKERMREFRFYSFRHDPVIIAASSHYNPESITVPTTIQRSSREPGKPLVTVWIPFWIEADRKFVEEFVRDTFAVAITHELEHAAEGFWRQERDHSQAENARTEAEVWGITCNNAVFPMLRRGRIPGPQERMVCERFRSLGGRTDSPEFIGFVAGNLTSGRGIN